MNPLPSALIAPQFARKQKRFRHVHELLLEISVLEMELQRLRMEEAKLFRRMEQIRTRKALLGQQQSQLYHRLKISDAVGERFVAPNPHTHTDIHQQARKMPEGLRHQIWEY